jgi:2-amino-4-hydroxy-6-hydroxymethyldihydropteridine diphosphokinase
MHKVFLGLGGNIGNKEENFIRVHQLIGKILGPIQQASSVYETPPWGFHAENNFWNQVVLIETKLEAEELLWRIKEIEEMFGRKERLPEEERYTSRVMDIDILYFDEEYFETKTLIVPHPRIHERLFVIVPLAEIAPDFKHPLRRLTQLTLLENCRDKSIIKKVDFQIPEKPAE